MSTPARDRCSQNSAYPVISAVSGKGGVAKTTLLMALALESAASGKSVAYIDTESNQNGATALKDHAFSNLSIFGNTGNMSFADRLLVARKSAEIILVDTDRYDRANETLICISSDLVIVPSGASGYDLTETSRTDHRIAAAEAAFGRRIARKLLWTQAPVLPTANDEAARAEFLADEGMSCFRSRLFKRTQLCEMMMLAAPLSKFAPESNATSNVLEMVGEVLAEVGIAFAPSLEPLAV